MVSELRQHVTLSEFEAFVERPENSEQRFELIGGEIYEVPSNPYVSEIAAKILILIGVYLLEHKIGHVTGADGGYMVNGERYAPDVAYISYERQPQLARQGYNPNPPELAIEVISDTKNSQEQIVLRRKIANYMSAGVLVWVVNPDEQIVEVYEIGQPVEILDASATLDAGKLLPEFKLPIKDIFPLQNNDPESGE